VPLHRELLIPTARMTLNFSSTVPFMPAMQYHLPIVIADQSTRRATTTAVATTVPLPATRTRTTTPTRMVATTTPTPTVCVSCGSKSLRMPFKGSTDTACRLYLPQRWSGWQHLHPAERRKEVNYFATLASSSRHVTWLVKKRDEHVFVVLRDLSQPD
jgi:hypothetical protein